MAFTAADVKELREMTGCGMMDCKKALVECDGDMDKAAEKFFAQPFDASGVDAYTGRIGSK